MAKVSLNRALKRTIALLCVSIAFLLCSTALFHSSKARASNGFESFEDAEILDKLAYKVAREYGNQYKFKFQFKLIAKDSARLSPLLVQYQSANKNCIFWISPKEEAWHSFENYLRFFDGLPKQVVYEAFFAHEAGHCVQFREEIFFGSAENGTRQELFSDVFALSHVERHYPTWRIAFQNSLLKMRRVERGLGSSYDFAQDLQKFTQSRDFVSVLRIKEPGERAFMMAKVIDLL